jgi:SOS-response transcriptional repressor LexA
MENEFPARLEKVLSELSLSNQQFADIIGIPNTTVSKYKKGTIRPSFDILAKIGKLLQVNTNWLLTGEGTMLDKQSLEHIQHAADEEVESLKQIGIPLSGELVKLPYYPQGIPCGTIGIKYEDYFETFNLPKEFSSGADFVLRADGDSMIEANIPNNAKLLVRKQTYIDKAGDIMIFCHLDHGSICRKVFYQDHKLVLKAAHSDPKYNDILIDDDHWTIVGKVVRIIIDPV